MTPEAAKALADAGPWAVVLFIVGIVGLVAARIIRVLWADHIRADSDDRAQRDRAQAMADRLEADVHGFSEAWQDAERRRRGSD